MLALNLFYFVGKKEKNLILFGACWSRVSQQLYSLICPFEILILLYYLFSKSIHHFLINCIGSLRIPWGYCKFFLVSYGSLMQEFFESFYEFFRAIEQIFYKFMSF